MTLLELENTPSVGKEPMRELRTCVVRGVMCGVSTWLHACSSSRSGLLWVSRRQVRRCEHCWTCTRFETVLCALARKEVADVWMSSMHASSCTRPRRLGILQCLPSTPYVGYREGTNIMFRDIQVCLVCTSTLPRNTLLDAHKYADNEQNCVERCHHVERTSR